MALGGSRFSLGGQGGGQAAAGSGRAPPWQRPLLPTSSSTGLPPTGPWGPWASPTCFAAGSCFLRASCPPRLQAHLLHVLLQHHRALTLLLQLPLRLQKLAVALLHPGDERTCKGLPCALAGCAAPSPAHPLRLSKGCTLLTRVAVAPVLHVYRSDVFQQEGALKKSHRSPRLKMKKPARCPLPITPSSCSPEATPSNIFSCRCDCTLPHFHRCLCCYFQGLNITF